MSEIKKYIVFEDGMGIMFPLHETHKKMAARTLNKPVSAGFVAINGKMLSCYGESLSLGLKAREGDEKYFKGE